ncbi:MAG: CPBP family intramembrane metalloprotease [Deltaproteobacteria bacterium]|nr:CPBP family intramembrane metalloprotease [Deltaproteobacteria bacterium]
MKNETTHTQKKSLNDVRAPVMMLYVLAYCGGHMSGIPHWVLLLFSAVAFVGISFLFERKTLLKMLVPGWKSSVIGLVVAAILYVIMWRVMQAVSDIVMGEGAVIDRSAIPGPIRMLLEIRHHASQIPIFVAGLGGALVLAPAEEAFWRGFVQTRIVGRAGSILGVGIVSILYGGFWGLFVNPIAGLAATIAGLAFSILTLRSRSLIPAMISHAVLWVFGIWLLPLY